jgi:hypothetical protein
MGQDSEAAAEFVAIVRTDHQGTRNPTVAAVVWPFTVAMSSVFALAECVHHPNYTLLRQSLTDSSFFPSRFIIVSDESLVRFELTPGVAAKVRPVPPALEGGSDVGRIPGREAGIPQALAAAGEKGS